MMKHELQTHSAPGAERAAGAAGEESWDALFDRIRRLALRRTAAMECAGDDEETFDRGARSLRTLMGAADITRRMKREEAKEQEHDGAPDLPDVTDEAIRELKRKLDRQIERIVEEDEAAADRSDEDVLSDADRKILGSECA